MEKLLDMSTVCAKIPTATIVAISAFIAKMVAAHVYAIESKYCNYNSRMNVTFKLYILCYSINRQAG